MLWAFTAAHRLSLAVVSGEYSLGAAHVVLIVVSSRCGALTLGRTGFSSHGAWT